MNKPYLLLILVLAFCLFTPSVLALNTTLDYNDILDDVYIDQDTPDTNFGSNVGLSTDDRSSSVDHTYIKFDLSSLPVDTVLENAEICMAPAGLVGVDQRNITVFEGDTDSWTEETATWNNPITNNATGEYNITGNNAFWVFNVHQCWNVTPMASRNLEDQILTAVFKETGGTGAVQTAFSSKERSETAYRPYMIVNYTSATSITSCQDITATGTYEVTANITATKERCLNISADNVTLDLNGYTLFPGGYNYVIYISDDSAEPSPIHNVEVKDGFIYSGETGIEIRGADGITVNNVEFYSLDYGINAIVLGYDYDDTNNTFITNNTFLACAENCIDINTGYYISISDNTFQIGQASANAIDLFDVQNSSVSENIMGNLTGVGGICITAGFDFLGAFFNQGGIGWVFSWLTYDDLTCTSLTYPNANGYNNGIRCDDCENNYFISNTMWGTKDMILTGTSFYNNVIGNQFLRKESEFNGCFLGSDTYDNFGCGNEGTIIDTGENNNFEFSCETLPENETGSCTPGYYCQDSGTLVYTSAGCSVINSTSCSSGCVPDATESYCEGGVITDEEEATTSLFPIGSMFGVPSADMLFTPVFLGTMLFLVIGAYLESAVKGGGGRIIIMVMLLGAVVLTYFGIYPLWVGVILAIGMGAIVVMGVKNTVFGGG